MICKQHELFDHSIHSIPKLSTLNRVPKFNKQKHELIRMKEKWQNYTIFSRVILYQKNTTTWRRPCFQCCCISILVVCIRPVENFCRVSLGLHPSSVSLSVTHLYRNGSDSFCPPGYVVTTRCDRSNHGGGILIFKQGEILFEEVDITSISIAERTEFLLFPCYSYQPFIWMQQGLIIS